MAKPSLRKAMGWANTFYSQRASQNDMFSKAGLRREKPAQREQETIHDRLSKIKEMQRTNKEILG